jgi:hypothetical protein
MWGEGVKYFFLSGLFIVLCLSGCVTSTSETGAGISSQLKEFELGKFSPVSSKEEILPLPEAYSLYRSSHAKPSGVHIHSGIVFVIVNIDTPQKKDRKTAKWQAMMKSQELLRKHFSLPQKIVLESRQLESSQYYSRKFFRYCIAYSLQDILDYQKTHRLK